MIQYDITSSRMRIGWIKPEKIPQGASIQPLSFMPVQTAVTRSSSITDDPLFSKSAIASVSEGAMVQWLGSMGEYAYIEFYASGFPLRGFILASSLTMISSGSQESAVAAPHDTACSRAKLYCQQSEPRGSSPFAQPPLDPGQVAGQVL